MDYVKGFVVVGVWAAAAAMFAHWLHGVTYWGEDLRLALGTAVGFPVAVAFYALMVHIGLWKYPETIK